MIQKPMHAPKIAIIVPVYNVERYVAECLESICNQTYKNWECFIVDDGATDASGRIADEYALKDKRFKVFHIQNSGLGGARNYALERLEEMPSQYAYVAFVDSDDVIDKTMYSRLVDIVTQDNTDLAICSFYDFFKSGCRNNHYSAKNEVITKEDFVELIYGFGRWRNHPCSQGMVWKLLIRYECLDGLRFPVDRGICEDEPFDILLANEVERISLLPEALYGYRQRMGSLLRAKGFNHGLIKGREICVEVAANISSRARLATLGAYLNALLALAKNSGSISHFKQVKYDPNDDTLEQLVIHGYVNNKNVRMLRLMKKASTVLRLYLGIRSAFHQIRKKFFKQEDIYFP